MKSASIIPALIFSASIFSVLGGLCACGDGNGNENPDAGQGVDGGIVNVQCNPNFGQAEACGGMSEGTWNYQAACGTTPVRAALENACDTVDIRAERFENGSGTLSISGGTFDLSVQTTVRVEAGIPVACTMGLGCGAAEMLIESDGSADATCTPNGSDCDCVIVANYSAVSDGTVSTSGGVATVDGNEQYYFCVQGNSMSYKRFDIEDQPVFVLRQ